ncbi:iron complex transport system permease protein [Kandleria vitulina]|uniref:Iron complex transport system permease protein n=1 Tax=Kandleria vitulina TaxID=1630 RepID=A0A1H2SIK0_9FIRM|nr:iron ABC transporter permease [Kandleria vitulina]SDW31420.1 iron complex transport system permease protein [Kandleria vitulina]
MKQPKKLSTFFLLIVLLTLIMAVLSLMLGKVTVSFKSVIEAFDSSIVNNEVNIVRARMPRTIFALLAGCSLSVSGALMQSITRNPIADPSILGVNTGAALFVIMGMSFSQVGRISSLVLAFVGGLLTMVCVYLISSFGYGGMTPIKLALAGAAMSIALQSIVNALMLKDRLLMDRFRFWQVGSLSKASWQDIMTVLPVIIVSLIIAYLLSSSLDIMALGDEMATSLGINVSYIYVLSTIVGVLLCASITALAGPIGFVGLMIPHFVRLLCGNAMKKVLLFSALLGSAVLLSSDIIGRLVGGSTEIEVGIIMALLGAPVFIMIVRKVKKYGFT